MANDGFVNEDILLIALNGKKYCQLNQNLKKFLSFIFDNLDDDNKIYVEKPKIKCTKTDLIISFNGVSKNISIKKGSGNSVHQEKFDEFISFLKQNKVPLNIINNIKLFHFGDDTINDTGKTRYSANECKKRYAKEIEQINIFLSQREILNILMNRFLFKGNIQDGKTVDYVYHGTINDGIWASKDEIINYFLNNNFKSNAFHIASLTYQVWGRDEKFRAKNPDRRYTMQIKWGNIKKDLSEITKHRK